MKKVLVTEKIGSKAIDIIKEVAEVVFVPEGDVKEFKRLIKGVCAVVLDTTIEFSAEIMDLAPQLKVISRTGAGVDNVDVKAATKRGILVLYTPEANTITVAEHTTALIGAISKQLVFLDGELRKGNFKTVRRLYLPIDLDGKTLGIIGYGRIGKAVAQKCMNAFNMKVIVYDPYINDSDIPQGVIRCNSNKQVFSEADFVSLHVPLTNETRNHLNKSLLSLMKPTTYLINTARGNIVDEDYLAKMLRENRLAGAAFDVLTDEPPMPSDELLNAPNTIISPHSAGLTKECVVRVAIEAANGIVDYLKGKTPKFIFNKEVLNK